MARGLLETTVVSACLRVGLRMHECHMVNHMVNYVINACTCMQVERLTLLMCVEKLQYCIRTFFYYIWCACLLCPVCKFHLPWSMVLVIFREIYLGLAMAEGLLIASSSSGVVDIFRFG